MRARGAWPPGAKLGFLLLPLCLSLPLPVWTEVKCIMILDLHGSGTTATGFPKVEDFDDRNQANMKFMRQVVIEVLGPVYVLNAPWVAVKAFNWFKALVPERFSQKLMLLDGDGTSDQDSLQHIGANGTILQFVFEIAPVSWSMVHELHGLLLLLRISWSWCPSRS